MHKFAVIFTLLFSLFSTAFAADTEFHYDPYSFSCKSTDGRVGYNPNLLGECGDQSGAKLSGKNLERAMLGAKTH